MNRFTIRRMTRADLDTAVDWAANEGWNPGLHDADAFFTADPQGFFLGELDGNPLSCISAVRYGSTFGFIGLYIVKPEHRGKGFGIQTWREGLAHLAGRTIGLDGVLEQQPNYRKSGFELAYRNVRFEGRIESEASPLARPLGEFPFETIHEYDRTLFPEGRESFLRSWLKLQNSWSYGVGGANGLTGYGVIRKCRSGLKVGPLFADDESAADILFGSLASHAGGEPVYLDPPEPNAAAIRLANRWGMQSVFETARMYTPPAPVCPVDRIFGVTTFELG